ncbi:glycosyltransferase family 2 protein [Stenomitos frigidus]|uniref:Family 2 glycosyl transferase n=1 Tax=Stenomitos frigidus ULC18 TaxID=2107698 RepID=A0A2T1ESN9_9CYAN|nr:glycosyltransferase family 2 protein [Stenomitos frigidus]PSB35721.1 family 2 glycosyl transferase [Stenomitos frigidus ULC18]
MEAVNHPSEAINSESINYPSITSLSDSIHRPLWSVMIPTYNGTKYLKQTLCSILEQDPGVDRMQIEVIDDCSTDDDPEALVKEIGQGRVAFFRQPHNMGQIKNWNTCIQRAQGHWIQILHQDDVVLPGFYRQLQAATTTDASIGAAFCRHIYMDEEGHWQGLSSIEQKTAGVLENWLETIAVIQRIQFPSIVVKRSTYEQLGGFCPQAYSASDWEMWKRIAAHYAIWYEPKPLACFRLHSASESSRLIKSGDNIAHTYLAIEISKTYLPESTVEKLSNNAKEHYALYALNTARQMVAISDWETAFSQIQAAMKCSSSFKVKIKTLQLLQWATSRWFLRQLKASN